MSALMLAVVGHNVLSSDSDCLRVSGALWSKGAWWIAGMIVLCCVSPTSLGFVVQFFRNLFAQLETCFRQHDSSIYNVLLTDMFGSLGEMPLRSVLGRYCQKHTVPSVCSQPQQRPRISLFLWISFMCRQNEVKILLLAFLNGVCNTCLPQVTRLSVQ